jgi:glutathione S-transferase
MIILYELSWSHYCEKVRLALDHMHLPWRAESIDAFAKAPLRARSRPAQLPSYTVPAILDDATNAYVMDSTPILRYLAETYPKPIGPIARRAPIRPRAEQGAPVPRGALRHEFTRDPTLEIEGGSGSS